MAIISDDVFNEVSIDLPKKDDDVSATRDGDKERESIAEKLKATYCIPLEFSLDSRNERRKRIGQELVLTLERAYGTTRDIQTILVSICGGGDWGYLLGTWIEYRAEAYKKYQKTTSVWIPWFKTSLAGKEKGT
ncbi:3-oxo-5-alpha-steroid 4-dehydrogenase [Perilla frutescens var. hirtella]|nr:3-oxo-5-alpha-steroid 4-dehydrogenase [Perilla frutescens var. hirtella]